MGICCLITNRKQIVENRHIKKTKKYSFCPLTKNKGWVPQRYFR